MIGATHVFWKLGKRSQADQQPKRRGRRDLELSEAGQPVGGTCDGRYKKSVGRAACPGVIIKSWGGAECPGPLSFTLAAVSHDTLRPADAETLTAALQGAGLAADGMQGAWVQGGARMGPGGFSLGFYKSARKTATFMLRCHSQGPTQDQLLADFDSLS